MIKPGEIGVKNPEVLRALMEYRYAPLLVTIIGEIAKKFGVFITDAWRKKRHRGDVHGTKPGRGIDLRVRFYGSLEQANKIKDWINKRWEYDPKRPTIKVVIIHDSGEGIHFHVQVHPRTRRRNPYND